MGPFCRLASGLMAVLALLIPGRQGPVRAAQADASRLQAAAVLESALVDSASAGEPERQLAVFRSAAAEVLKTMSANLLVAEALQQAEQSTEADPRQAVKMWRAAMTEARDLLRFEPLMEAPLPEGFPEPTPVGEIRVQAYPAYRLARTQIDSAGGRAFWTLFNHIKQREIAMTAPVEMTYSDDSDQQPRIASMAFLYRSVQQGSLGAAGDVEVIDVPAQTAISIGLRGNVTDERLAAAKRGLAGWLQDHGAEYEAAGPVRVLGYNSPFVAAAKKYTEVQIPVRAKQ